MASSTPREELLKGFAPVHAPSAGVLVLGSMPGARSLADGQYYAHPRNAFWPIMRELFGIDPQAPYLERLELLRANRIALWDVIGRCRRAGSLDHKVEPDSIVPNDFASLFRACPALGLVAFNGRLAEHSYRRHVLPDLTARFAAIERVRLPSTSPAHAAMTFEQKCSAWRAALAGRGSER